MRNLFRSCDRRGVEYLLIGGQASVLYGAAQFTQDFDLWIRPSEKNIGRFLEALAAAGASVHKLTPPMTLRNARRGHGFHFIIPQRRGLGVPLDVMACPPRVGSFAAARRRSQVMKTPWGRVPVVSIEDLVRLKRTNRPGDYEVIARLVRIRLDAVTKPGRRLLLWAVENTLVTESLVSLVVRHGEALARLIHVLPLPARALIARIAKGREPSLSDMARVDRLLSRAAAHLIQQGRRYWTPRIAELREMRSKGILWPERTPVKLLLGKSAG